MLRPIPGANALGCEHVPARPPVPASDSCEGGRASQRALRMCAACGRVGRCESQDGYARAHALSLGHPVILSLPLESGFTWSYVEKAYVG